MILLPLFAILLSHSTVRAQQAFFPAAIPLAVRSPYLNCWLQSGPAPASAFGSTWPTTFNVSQVCHLCTVYLAGDEILSLPRVRS